MLEENFFTRHSIKPKGDESEKYEGISESGVDLARERAAEILAMLKSMEDGSVMFIGGSSEAVRTKSTARVYGDEAKKLVAESKTEDVVVVTEKDLDGQPKAIDKIIEIVRNSGDKKVLIDYPLFIKEFAMSKWLNEKGDLSDYAKELLKRNNNDEVACVADWFENKGRIGDLQGPDPIEVAEDHLRGIARLRKFAEGQVKDRNISVGMVGHSWNLDALATYLANNGEIDARGFEKVGGKLISETQMGRIEVGKDGRIVLKYGGNDYEVAKENEIDIE